MLFVFFCYVLFYVVNIWRRNIKHFIHDNNEKEGKKCNFILRFTEFFLSSDFTSPILQFKVVMVRNQTHVFISLLSGNNGLCARHCIVYLLNSPSRYKPFCDPLDLLSQALPDLVCCSSQSPGMLWDAPSSRPHMYLLNERTKAFAVPFPLEPVLPDLYLSSGTVVISLYEFLECLDFFFVLPVSS